ncbi:MAG: 4-hydroxy-tetrahydrodipicolinate reductase [Alphaproteobacteria bacterium]
MTLAIAIAGAGGHMGRALIAAAQQNPAFRIVGATKRPGSGALTGEQSIAPVEDVRAAAASTDVWIDFTTPAATLAALDALAATPARAVVIGTTGFTPDDEAKIAAAAQRIAIVRAGNFSLGVNLIVALAEQAARRLGPDWDAEILEAHHRRKVDSPSGTALMLGEAVAKGRGKKLAELRADPHQGDVAPREHGKIGFASVRGGGIVGEHEVIFAGEREVVMLSHQALDRAVFADGALTAALWVADKPPGLYAMRDVLGF